MSAWRKERCEGRTVAARTVQSSILSRYTGWSRDQRRAANSSTDMNKSALPTPKRIGPWFIFPTPPEINPSDEKLNPPDEKLNPGPVPFFEKFPLTLPKPSPSLFIDPGVGEGICTVSISCEFESSNDRGSVSDNK